MTQERKLAAPAVYPETEVYWQAAAEGKLMVKRCRDCGEYHHYPRSICPHCFSDNTEWCEARGTGTIYTLSVGRRVGPVPYVIAYVTLDEGVSMLTNIVDCDFDALRIGDRVKVVMKPSENGTMVPMFTPV